MSSLSRMTGLERGFAAAAFDGIFPRGSDERLPQGAADGDMVGLFENARAGVPPRVALGLRVAVWIVALAPLVTIGKFATIASLATTDRERVVLALLSSNVYMIRQLTTLLIVGVISTFILAKLKNGKSDGFIFHLAYWYGVPSFAIKGVPSGAIREFVE